MVISHFSRPPEKGTKSKNTSCSPFQYKYTLPLLLPLTPILLTSLPSKVLSIFTEHSLLNQRSSGTSPVRPSSPPYANTLLVPSLKSLWARATHSTSPLSPSRTLSSPASHWASWYPLLLILQYTVNNIDSLYLNWFSLYLNWFSLCIYSNKIEFQ